jgi:peptidoglycan hydrolase CwlO-like protein
MGARRSRGGRGSGILGAIIVSIFAAQGEAIKAAKEKLAGVNPAVEEAKAQYEADMQNLDRRIEKINAKITEAESRIAQAEKRLGELSLGEKERT